MIDPTYGVTVAQAKEFLQRAMKELPPEDMSDNRATTIAALQNLIKDIPDDTPVYEIGRMLDKCGVQWE